MVVFINLGLHVKVNQTQINLFEKYKQYFAPVVDACPISINSIENEEIKKCEIINETSEKYISYKIRYVGKNTLSDYLLDVYTTMPKSFLKILFTTNIDILEEVSILNANHIIHMDLKENNIIIDDVLKKPIIIDFGLSYQSKTLTDSTIKKYFFIYQDYSPWCFEINLINCILNTIVTDKNSIDINTTKIKMNDLETICNKFIKDNTFLQNNFDTTELEAFKKTLLQYAYTNKDKTLNDVKTELLKFSNTWDNYSIAIIYFSIIKENKLDDLGSKLFKDYIKLLKNIILSSPDKRPTCENTKSAILSLTQSVLKNDKTIMNDQIIKNSNDDIFIKIQNKLSAKNKLDNLTKQAEIYKVKLD